VDRRALADGGLLIRFFPRDGHGTVGDVSVSFKR
jgi:hypothetical protein